MEKQQPTQFQSRKEGLRQFDNWRRLIIHEWMQTLAAAQSPISTIPSSIKNIQKRKKMIKRVILELSMICWG
jgi:hypothetical protein